MQIESIPPEDRRSVLVVYASRSGGTAGIAQVVADRLREHEVDVDVVPADTAWREQAPVEGYDAVVVGSALYTRQWRPEAVRFLRRHVRALADRPLWLFQSGPCGPDAARDAEEGAPEPAAVRRLRGRIPASAPITFGGVLDLSTARGFLARRMAQGERAGDYRDPERIRAWADTIADSLTRRRESAPPTAGAGHTTPDPAPVAGNGSFVRPS